MNGNFLALVYRWVYFFFFQITNEAFLLWLIVFHFDANTKMKEILLSSKKMSAPREEPSKTNVSILCLHLSTSNPLNPLMGKRHGKRLFSVFLFSFAHSFLISAWAKPGIAIYSFGAFISFHCPVS